MVDALDDNGVDTTDFRKFLIQTGEVSTDIFNPQIMLGLLEEQFDSVSEWTKRNAGSFFTHAILFVPILFVFRMIARVASFMIQRSFDSNKVQVSQLLQHMLLSLSSRGIMFLGFLVALSQMGLEITALLTGLGIAGFIVGFALQDSLANFVAGLMILGYRPYDVGDVIEAGGVTGKVNRMSLVSTTVLTFDNQTMIVPNNKIWGDVIKNVTLQMQRRIDLEFNIALDEDIEKVKSIIKEVLETQELVKDDPAPTVEFNSISPYSMVIIVWAWVDKTDYFPVKWDLLKKIKEALDKEGIKIPVLNQGLIAAP